MLTDYYKILGVSQNATSEEIRQAYRQKAKILHPDVNSNPDAKLSFQILSEAYQVLRNSDKKRWYDFKLKYPSSVATKYRAREKYSNPGQRGENPVRNKNYQKQAKDDKYKKTFADKLFFYVLMLSGIMALIFGIYQLIFSDAKDDNKFSGIVTAIWFLFFLIYGWSLLGKK